MVVGNENMVVVPDVGYQNLDGLNDGLSWNAPQVSVHEKTINADVMFFTITLVTCFKFFIKIIIFQRCLDSLFRKV